MSYPLKSHVTGIYRLISGLKLCISELMPSFAVKKHNMYKPLFFVCLALLSSVLLSCYNDKNTFGDKWVNSELRNISMDTSTIITTAVLIDSLETSGKHVVLAGKYTHPVWGSVSATGYIPYLRPSYSTESNETVQFDSLMLVLSCNKTFVGDTTLQQKYAIHLLTEKVVLNENGYLYT